MVEKCLRFGRTDVLAVDASRYFGRDVEAESSDSVFPVIQAAESICNSKDVSSQSVRSLVFTSK